MKKIMLSFDWWSAVVEINYNENTLAWMKDQVLFWSGGQELIDDQDGDVEKAYLKMLAGKLLLLSQEYNLFGVTEELKEAEGWASLDERFGVKLINIDSWEFQERDIEVEEI